MKQTIKSQTATSTYSLLIRSEDREQSLSETAVYLLLIACAAFTMWFAAHQPVHLPLGAAMHPTQAVVAAF